MPMPNRQIVNGEPYRYAYQGQEKDPETGKEAFQLRLWDGRIGRWLTTDPKGEFSSPYLGMGNNPIKLIDPDGGSTETQWVDSKGNVVHDDGIDNGTIYLVNDGFEFNGDVDKLTNNSTLLVKDFKVVANESQIEKFVISQFSKGEDYLHSSMFDKIKVNGKSRSFSFSVRSGRVKRSDGKVEKVRPKSQVLSINYNTKDISPMFGNVYNVRNSLEHESNHYYRGLSTLEKRIIYDNAGKMALDSEVRAINYQRSTSTWHKTTKKFKESVQWYWDYNHRLFGGM